MLRLYLGMLVMSFGNQFIQQWVGYEEVQLINNIFRDLLVGTIMMYGVDNFAAGVKKKAWVVYYGAFCSFCFHS